MLNKVSLFTDGGARGNPGPAAIGVRVVLHSVPEAVYLFGECIGSATNNVAEYRALIFGLKHIQELVPVVMQKQTTIFVHSDSELMVRQMQGVYKVKNEQLAELWAKAKRFEAIFSRVIFQSIPRARNSIADAIVNDMLDFGRIRLEK